MRWDASDGKKVIEREKMRRDGNIAQPSSFQSQSWWAGRVSRRRKRVGISFRFGVANILIAKHNPHDQP